MSTGIYMEGKDSVSARIQPAQWPQEPRPAAGGAMAVRPAVRRFWWRWTRLPRQSYHAAFSRAHSTTRHLPRRSGSGRILAHPDAPCFGRERPVLLVFLLFGGMPDRLRRPVLYPAELRAQMEKSPITTGLFTRQASVVVHAYHARLPRPGRERPPADARPRPARKSPW